MIAQASNSGLCVRRTLIHSGKRTSLAIWMLMTLSLVVIIQSGCAGVTSAKGNSTLTSSNTTPSGALSVSPAAVTFGNVPVGSTSNQSLSVSNSGSLAVTISQATTTGAGFGIGGASLPLTLSPGNSFTFTASFAPTATGNASGSVSVASAQLSSPLTIQMTGTGAAVAPAITSQPSSQSVLIGQTATFSVTASGTAPLSYQWRKNGTAISGATSSSYTTPAETTSDNGALFTVAVSNSAGTATSNGAVLTVNPAPVAPSITTQPSSQTITAGQTATFSVAATGTTPLSYRWQKNGAAISSATLSSYTTPAEIASDNGAQFTVAVSNSAGTATSNSAVLTVNPAQPLQITTTSGLPSGQMQTSYSASLQATGGTPPYAWSVISGQLPNGLSLSPSNGTITGTPTLAGTFTFTIQVKDNSGGSASAGFSIIITTTPQFGHVAIVVEENTNYSSVVGTSAMPYLNSLMSQYGLATQYYANTHPSIGNYFMLTTGQILTNDDSQTPSSFPVSADNIAREIELAGKTWKDYRELTGTYYVRHDPLAYMTNINSANLVSFPQFATDLANGTLPNFSWIAPNGCDDAHDCSLSTADSWLQTNIDPLIKNPTFQKDGLLVIVFDESANDNASGGGRVVAVLISPPFSHVNYQSSTFYQHESVLRLMLEGLGITVLPGAAATAQPMWEFFDPPAGTVTPLAISTTSLLAGTVGQGYTAQLNATGGTTPYAWSVASGSVPLGLTLLSSGAISGIPTAAGTSAFTVKVTDVNLLAAQQNFSISTSLGTTCSPIGSAGVCYYVATTGSDSNPGTSAAPFLTIGHAATVVNPGDEVIVRSGIYTDTTLGGSPGGNPGTKFINMTRGGAASCAGTSATCYVTFISEVKGGAIVDGNGDLWATGFEFAANYIIVKDFEIRNFSDTGLENYSGGQFIDIVGNNIHDIGRYCTSTSIGRDGIFLSNPNVIVEQNLIHDIGRGAVGETLFGTTCSSTSTSLDHGVYQHDGGFTDYKNNVFYRNEHGWSIQLYPNTLSNIRILNNTFFCPNPGQPGQIVLDLPTLTNSLIENNIFHNPAAGALKYGNTSGWSGNTWANNIIFGGVLDSSAAPGGVTESGNLNNTDPLLVSIPSCTVDDASVPDPHLQVGSSAIDTGLTLPDVTNDYDGTTRPQGAGYDIGAIEFHP